MPEGFTPVPESIAKTLHDHLMLPSGKRLGDERKLSAVLVGLGVPGASHSHGRDVNAEAYRAHLDAIGKQAADAAVAAWLREHRS